MSLSNREISKHVSKYSGKTIQVNGWVRNNRDQKTFGFLVINDGTTLDSIQCVYSDQNPEFDVIKSIHTGASVEVTGILVETPTMAQPYEIQVSKVNLLGDAPIDFPIQAKRHTREFLRTQAHLRVRTNLFNAVFRVRGEIIYAIHEFFHKNGFYNVHTPIITANDGEGAGQMFTVTTLPLEHLVKEESIKEIDYSQDFFSKKVSLTVTGQLEAEALALGLNKVYTFGPTFRAENSNTLTHASEFWMIEPEMAFCDLAGDIKVMEALTKYLLKYAFKNLKPELEFFDKFVENGLIKRLTNDLESKFKVISHEDAISVLRAADVKFENEPKYGEDLAKEHERYLTDVYSKAPIFVTNWPKDIKAFYMKLNKDKKTVAAVDLLVPLAGELMGGSQREDDFDLLRKRMSELNMKEEGLEWYLELRKFGSCYHSGFGMGFERFLIYLTGVENIRDVQIFARTPKNCEF